MRRRWRRWRRRNDKKED